MSFSKRELRDLVISVLVLTFVFSRFDLTILPTIALVVVLVFVLHELGHKFMAQRYGCSAEYKMWPMGLILGIVTAFLGGIIFAAPGAVMISPYSKKKFAFRVVHLGRKEIGHIGLAGPAVNLVIGFVSLILLFLYSHNLFFLISQISFFLALFNLIPFGMLDGRKIMNWNKYIWGASIVLAVLGYIFLLV